MKALQLEQQDWRLNNHLRSVFGPCADNILSQIGNNVYLDFVLRIQAGSFMNGVEIPLTQVLQVALRSLT